MLKNECHIKITLEGEDDHSHLFQQYPLRLGNDDLQTYHRPKFGFLPSTITPGE